MTVQELIEQLSKQDPTHEAVWIGHGQVMPIATVSPFMVGRSLNGQLAVNRVEHNIPVVMVR